MGLVRGLDLGLGLGEDGRLLEADAYPEADEDHDGREEERGAPAPGVERGVGLEDREQPEDTGREEVAEGHTGLRPARPEAAVLVLAVLGHHEDRAAPLAADREALDQAAQEQQQRRRDADRRVGRQEADRDGRAAHHEQRDDEHLLAPDPVPVVAEDDTAERAGDEAEGVGAEREERAGQRVAVGEEQAAEDEGRGGAVEEESYHSTAVPTTLAKTILTMLLRVGVGDAEPAGLTTVSDMSRNRRDVRGRGGGARDGHISTRRVVRGATPEHGRRDGGVRSSAPSTHRRVGGAGEATPGLPPDAAHPVRSCPAPRVVVPH